MKDSDKTVEDITTVIERKVIEFANTINRGSEERAFLRKALTEVSTASRREAAVICRSDKFEHPNPKRDEFKLGWNDACEKLARLFELQKES